MSLRVVELLSSWRGRFTRHRNVEIWGASPLCVMWILWKEQSSHTFEDIEWTLVELKLLFLHFFNYEWMAATPFSHFLGLH